MSTATQPPAPPDQQEHERRARRVTPAGPASLGPLLRRLHFYAGIFVAPFLVVAALTGIAYAVTPQLDQFAYGGQLTVSPGDQHAPVAAQVTAAEAVVPDGELLEVIVPEAPDASTQVVFDVPELTDRQRTVYVDPYEAQVLGVLDTSFGKTPLTMWFRDLHGNLHLGEPGALYSELAASWLAVLAVSGSVLWWRHHRRGSGRLRRLLWGSANPGHGVRRTRNWHGRTGVWLLVGLLALSATGLTWSTYAGARFDLLQENLRATQIAPDTSVPSGVQDGVLAAGADDPTRFDTVLTAARDHGLDGPLDITPAEEAGQAWTVSQSDSALPVRLDSAAVDPATGVVTDEVSWQEQPLLAKLSSHGIQAHMGLLFGPPNQLLMVALAAGVLAMVVWGYRMWWQRRPTRADRRLPMGTPPPRGGWRRLPLPVLLLGIPVVVAVGWALPLLGLSLAGFLLLDLVLGAVRRVRPVSARGT